jgi:hypothetical protein
MVTRRVITLVAPAAAAAVTCALVALLATSAQAAAYRYWTYWQAVPGTNSWGFATQGPGTAVPPDGAVEGWSYSISAESATADAAPGVAPDFDAACVGVGSVPGTKRVALVIDPGPAAIAPEGEQPIEAVAECVQIEEEATGYDILRSVAQVRTEDGLVCGVDGYPERECAPILDDAQATTLTARTVEPVAEPVTKQAGEPVAEPVAEQAGEQVESSESSGTPVATIVVVGLLAIGVVIFLWTRRRRT